MPEMQFEWEGLIRLLAQNLYSEKRIFIRELIQNAHDAILRRQQLEQNFGGRIDIESDVKDGVLSVRDNGIGMSESDIQDYLATIGTGATRAQEHIPGLIGYFGIGFLSAFIVAEKVVVLTRKIDSVQGWRWENTGSRDYTLDKEDVKTSGTTVLVHLKATEKGLLHEKEIIDVIKTYADLLRVPIHVNRKGVPSNAITMPWERDEYDAARLQIECSFYIYETTREDAIEVIPIRHRFMSGILYITRTRVIGVNAPRAVRVFLKRMFVSPNIPELLPQWATFVNGIVDSDQLLPTAARDNVVRDEVFEETRGFLDTLIIEYLDSLRRTNPDRFTKIQEYHSFSIRAACAYYEPFFEKFINLLEWRTTPAAVKETQALEVVKRRTLPQILEAIKIEQAGARRLSLRCFGSATASSQFFRMAASCGILVIDASEPYELGLLNKYVQHLAKQMPIDLVRIDREDDPVLFKSLGPEEMPAVTTLANSMQQKLNAQRLGDRKFDITVIARSFEPSIIPAIVRPGEDAESVEQARQILEDPNSPLSYRRLAEDVIRKGEALAMTLNANNNLVRKMAQSIDDADGARMALGLYNSAFLSSGMMSEHNATVLHDNLIYFIDCTLDAQAELRRLKAQNQSMAHDLAQFTQGPKGPEPSREARVHTAFVMIPFNVKYADIVNSLREVVEDRWFLQLFLASDRKYEDRILDSVRTHIEKADLFIADVSEANPNVMFELGAVFGGRKGRPIVTLVGNEGNNSGPVLPADLGSLIYVNYARARDTGGKALTDYLETEIRKDIQVQALITGIKNQKYISPKRLAEFLRGLMNSKVCEALSHSFPSESDWRTLREAQLREVLIPLGEGDAAAVVLNRVKSRLSEE